MNIIPPSSAHYQATLQQVTQGLLDGVDEYHEEIVKKKNAEAQAESDTPADVAGVVSTYASSRQPVIARVEAEYFSLRQDLQDRLADGLEQLDQVASQEFLSRGQQILYLEQEKAIYEREADEAKQAALAFLEEFKHDRILTKFEIQALTKVLKNPIRNYEATYRAKAAAILGQQPVLPKEVRLALKEVIDYQDQDEWVKIQATIALSNYEPLPDEYIKILLNGIKHQTEQYEVVYRANAAVALCQQSILSQEVCSDLEEILKEQDRGTQLKAAIALAGRGQLPKETIRVLLEAVQNSQYAAVERANAVYALCQEAILPEEVRLVLEEALTEQNQDEWVKVEIAIALASYARLSEAQTAILLDTIENKRYPLAYRSDAAYALSKLSVMPEQARLALNRCLQNDDKGVRLYAATALARKGLFLDEATSILVEVVGNKQYANFLRRNAAFALGKQTELLSQEAESALEAALSDPDNEVEIYEAVALAGQELFLDNNVTPVLVEVVGNKQYANFLRCNAAFALGEQTELLSQEAQSVLEAALNDPSSEVKIQAAAGLACQELFLDKVTPILVEVVGNKQYANFLRRNAAFALGEQTELLSQEARSALEAALNDPDNEVKIQAAAALAYKGHFLDKVISILIEMIGNKQYVNGLRGDAAFWLGKQSAVLSQEAESALEAALDDPDSEVKIQAAVALAHKKLLSDKVTPILVEAVGNKQYANFLRHNAALRLGEQSAVLSQEAESALEAALDDPDSEVKIQAAVALARKELFLDKVTPILVEVVGNKQYVNGLRGDAAFWLGKQSAVLSQEAESALEAALNDPDNEVKIQAAVALASKGHFPDKVTSILIEAVGNKQYVNTARGNAAYALSLKPELLETENVRSTLKAVLEDSDDRVRSYASEALKKYKQSQQPQQSRWSIFGW